MRAPVTAIGKARPPVALLLLMFCPENQCAKRIPKCQKETAYNQEHTKRLIGRTANNWQVFVGVEQNVSAEDDGQYMAALVDADVIEHKEGLTNGRINIAPIV
jgi:hypothetical protein